MALDEKNAQAGIGYPVIAQSIADHHARFSHHLPLPSLTQVSRLLALLEGTVHRRSVPYPDIRRQNSRVRNGTPLALLDWSNSLCFAPEMGRARIKEYAALTENGLDDEPLRLDASAMAAGLMILRQRGQ